MGRFSGVHAPQRKAPLKQSAAARDRTVSPRGLDADEKRGAEQNDAGRPPLLFQSLRPTEELDGGGREVHYDVVEEEGRGAAGGACGGALGLGRGRVRRRGRPPARGDVPEELPAVLRGARATRERCIVRGALLARLINDRRGRAGERRLRGAPYSQRTLSSTPAARGTGECPPRGNAVRGRRRRWPCVRNECGGSRGGQMAHARSRALLMPAFVRR